MIDLKNRLKADMIVAMKSGNKIKLSTIRSINAEIKQYEVDHREVVDDSRVIQILEKSRKQRAESITQYRNANREDLALVEQQEAEIIEAYLPAKLSNEEIAKIIKDAITEVKPQGISDMGKVMAIVKNQLLGRADMAAVSTAVREAIMS